MSQDTPDLKKQPSLGFTGYNGHFRSIFPLRRYTYPEEVNLKCLKTPQSNNLIQEELCNLTPHPNSSLVTPFFKLFHWSLLVPDVIDFDKEKGGFYCRKGAPLLRVCSYLWLLFLTIYLSLICFNDASERYTVKGIIAKCTWICYTVFDVLVVKCLRMNGNKIAKILSEGDRISHWCDEISRRNLEPPIKKKKTNVAKYAIYTVCILSVVYTAIFVLCVITELTKLTTNVYNIFMEITEDTENTNWRNHTMSYNLIQRYTSNFYAAGVLTFWLLMAFGVEIIWVIFLTMTASFGYYFNRLLKASIELIRNNQIDTGEGIRIFTQITLLIEDFNILFGRTLLWIITASVMYSALTIGEFLAGITNGLAYDLLNILGHIPVFATLYAGSELHKTGHILPSLIKRKFLSQDAIDQNQMFQLMQGTHIVQYDALSSNIALKGDGFFSISYSFLTTLIGVIITYSLVAVQFKLGEIPISQLTSV